MVKFECTRHWNPCVSSCLGEFPFLIFCLPFSGVIRIGICCFYYGKHGKKVDILWNKISLTGCKWSSLNAPGTETPVSHPVWVNSLFSFLPSFLWGSKNWHVVFIMGIMVKRWTFSGTKSVKQAANGPVWRPPGHTPLGVIHFSTY